MNEKDLAKELYKKYSAVCFAVPFSCFRKTIAVEICRFMILNLLIILKFWFENLSFTTGITIAAFVKEILMLQVSNILKDFLYSLAQQPFHNCQELLLNSYSPFASGGEWKTFIPCVDNWLFNGADISSFFLLWIMLINLDILFCFSPYFDPWFFWADS